MSDSSSSRKPFQRGSSLNTSLRERKPSTDFTGLPSHPASQSHPSESNGVQSHLDATSSLESRERIAAYKEERRKQLQARRTEKNVDSFSSSSDASLRRSLRLKDRTSQGASSISSSSSSCGVRRFITRDQQPWKESTSTETSGLDTTVRSTRASRLRAQMNVHGKPGDDAAKDEAIHRPAGEQSHGASRVSTNSSTDHNENFTERRTSFLRKGVESVISSTTESDNSSETGGAKFKDKSAKRKSNLNRASVVEEVIRPPLVSTHSTERRSRKLHHGKEGSQTSESDKNELSAAKLSESNKRSSSDSQSDCKTSTSVIQKRVPSEKLPDNRLKSKSLICKKQTALKKPEIPEVLKRTSSPAISNRSSPARDSDLPAHLKASTPKRASLTDATLTEVEQNRCDFNLSFNSSCCLSSDKHSDDSFHSLSQAPDTELEDAFGTPPEAFCSSAPSLPKESSIVYTISISTQGSSYPYEETSNVTEAVNVKPYTSFLGGIELSTLPEATASSSLNSEFSSEIAKVPVPILKCKIAEDVRREDIQGILKVRSKDEGQEEQQRKPPSILKKRDSSEEKEFESTLLNPIFRQFFDDLPVPGHSILKTKSLDDNATQPKPILKRASLSEDHNSESTYTRCAEIPRPILKKKTTEEETVLGEKPRPILKTRLSYEDMTENITSAFESDSGLLQSILRKSSAEKESMNGEHKKPARRNSDVTSDSTASLFSATSFSGRRNSGETSILVPLPPILKKLSDDLQVPSAKDEEKKDENTKTSSSALSKTDISSLTAVRRGGGLRVSDGVMPSVRERCDRRNTPRYRTQPITQFEVQETDSLESVQAFRTLITTKASLQTFEEEDVESEECQKEEALKKEYPQRYRPDRKKDRRTNSRYKTLPITLETPLEETPGCSPANANTSSSSSDELSGLSVMAKASLFQQKALESVGLGRRSSDVRSRYVTRRSNPRSQTQPITEEEVHEASKMVDGNKKETKEKTDDDKSDENDPSKLSLVEKMRLFNQKMVEEKQPKVSLEKGPRKRRSLQSRFQTQPITTEEVRKANRHSFGGLASSLRPPEPEEDDPLITNSSQNLFRSTVLRQAEKRLSPPSVPGRMSPTGRSRTESGPEGTQHPEPVTSRGRTLRNRTESEPVKEDIKSLSERRIRTESEPPKDDKPISNVGKTLSDRSAKTDSEPAKSERRIRTESEPPKDAKPISNVGKTFSDQRAKTDSEPVKSERRIRTESEPTKDAKPISKVGKTFSDQTQSKSTSNEGRTLSDQRARSESEPSKDVKPTSNVEKHSTKAESENSETKMTKKESGSDVERPIPPISSLRSRTESEPAPETKEVQLKVLKPETTVGRSLSERRARTESEPVMVKKESGSSSSSESEDYDDEDDTKKVLTGGQSHLVIASPAGPKQITNLAIQRKLNANLRRRLQQDPSAVKVLQQTHSTGTSTQESPSSPRNRGEGDTSGDKRSLVKRSQTQPMPPKSESESTPNIEGGSIKQRLAALQRSGTEDWQKRLFQSPENVAKNATPKSSIKAQALDSEDSPAEENGSSVIATRLARLQDSQKKWVHRVEAKDAVQFTVAGKMAADSGSRVGASNGTDAPSPSIERRSKKIPMPFKDSGTNAKTEKLDSDKTEAPLLMGLTKSKSVPLELGSLKKDQSSSEDEMAKVKQILVPKADNETFSSFFSTPQFFKSSSTVMNDDLPQITTESLDLVKSQTQQLTVHRRVQTQKRHHTGARNPIRALASRTDFQKQEYVEVASTGIAQKEVQRIQVEKLAKNSDKCLSALAGLASAEDFKNISLKKGGEINTQLPSLMLVQVKGRRHVQTRLVEPSSSSLNQGDSFVLVTPTKVFCWIGRYTNVIERSKVLEVASIVHLKKDLCFRGSSPPAVIDLGKKSEATENEKGTTTICSAKDIKAFYNLLGDEKMTENSVPEADLPEEDEQYESSVIGTNMVYVLEGDSLVPVKDCWGILPKIDILQTNKVLVFDFGSEMYVWKGKQSLQERRTLATKLAKQLWEKGYDYTECHINPIHPRSMKVPRKPDDEKGKSTGSDRQKVLEEMTSSVRPNWCIFSSVNQHMEPVLFREKFLDWPDSTRLIKVKGQEDETDNTAKGTEELKPCDAMEMLKRPCPEPDMILEGHNLGRGVKWQDSVERRFYEITTLEVNVWHILEYESRRLPYPNGQLHSGDTYVVRWRYMVTQRGRSLQGELSRRSMTGRERCAYFFWQGLHSRITEKGASALMTVELDEERGPQVRVNQGKEPPCFLNLFEGRMIIYKGERENEATNTQGPWKLFIVRGAFANEVFLVEVEPKAESLRSRASFLLVNCTTGLIHIWHGCHTCQKIQDVARQAAQNILDAQPEEMVFESGAILKTVEIQHGGEPKIFIEALSAGTADWKELGLVTSANKENSRPRLFHLTSVSGTFLAHEILGSFRSLECQCLLPFSQEDLYSASQPALFLMHPSRSHCLYLWQGWWPEGNEETVNVATGSANIRWVTDRRCAMQTALEYAKALNSDCPPKVYLVSAGLEPSDFTELFPDWHVVDSISQLNIQEGKKMGECLDANRVLAQLTRTHYTLEELQELPEGVDPLNLEKYLNETDFENIMKMTKDAFYKLPKWKQTKLKKEVHLF